MTPRTAAAAAAMHHKFVVIDECSVITGSANFTNSGLHGDADQHPGKRQPSAAHRQLPWLKYSDASLNGCGRWTGRSQDNHFGSGKAAMTLSGSVGDVEVEVLFSPHPKRNASHGLHWLAALLSSAQQQIDVALFVFSAQQLANVLEERANDGIKIDWWPTPASPADRSQRYWICWGWPCRIAIATRGQQSAFQKTDPRRGHPRLARGSSCITSSP